MATNISRSIRNNILVGLVLIIPLVVAVVVVNWLFKFVTNEFIALIPKELIKSYPLFLFRLAALLVILVGLFFLGLFVRNMVGKRLYQVADHVLARTPLINKIYVWVRQISETVLDQRQTLFQEVVLVEYPRKGVYSMGFVTAGVPPGFVPKGDGVDRVVVFIATVPNPTTGFFIFVPRSEVQVLPIEIGDAMKMLFSAGAVFPGSPSLDDRPTLLDKLELWVTSQGKGESKTDATPGPTP